LVQVVTEPAAPPQSLPLPESAGDMLVAQPESQVA
jgi:hypothetical protein